MMEQRVSLITLGVRDLARSRSFYEKGLGWQPGFSNDEVTFYQLNGLVLALWDWDALLADSRQKGTTFGTGAVCIAHNVRNREEADAVFTAVSKAGGTILKPAEETPWGGYSGYFADPDGHPWEVAVNPSWTIDEAGNTRMGDS